MKLSKGIIVFLKIGISLSVFFSCQRSDEIVESTFEATSLFYLIDYECDYEEFKNRSNCLLPVEIACYFRLVNKGENKKIYFSSNWIEFKSMKNLSSIIVNCNSDSSSSCFLIPLEQHKFVANAESLIVPFRLKFKQLQNKKDFFVGNDLLEVNKNARDLRFYIHEISERYENTVDSISNIGLHLYFVFNDTTITCTNKQCYPYIDTEYLIKELKY